MKAGRARSLQRGLLAAVLLQLPAFSGPSLGSFPLVFEPNRGQADPAAEFLARAPGQQIFLTSSGATIGLRRGEERAVLRLSFPGAGADIRYHGLEPSAGKSHYFRGAIPEDWVRDVPQFGRVRAAAVYPGIDIVFYGNRGRLEYDFVLAPGADPAAIRLQLAGAERTAIDPSGDLLIETPAGTVRQLALVAYQQVEDGRKPVPAVYENTPGGGIRFRLGPYDRRRELVIDPVISFSTFLGGGGLDDGRGVAVDAQGNIYVAGGTESFDYPTTEESFRPDYRSRDFPGDAFVTKLTPDGAAIIYSTFLGGAASDRANAIAVNAIGEAYVTGETESSNYPTTLGTYQLFNSSVGAFPEAFVTRLAADGGSLIYSTYLGDAFYDKAHAIAVDGSGSAYVAGSSDSDRFPTTEGAFQVSCAGLGFGGFVTKFAPDGRTLDYSTRLCGSANDEALAIAVDAAGDAYVGGVTGSTDFPVTFGAVQTAGGGDNEDGFVTKLAADGRQLVYSTYLGGMGSNNLAGTVSDAVLAIAVDGQGNAFTTGYTLSGDFPTTVGAFQPEHATGGGTSFDAFVSVLNTTGTGFVYSTFLGGVAQDHGAGIAVDDAGSAYVTGFTLSPDFPASALDCQTTFVGNGNRDAYISKLSPTGDAVEYSFFLGGAENDYGESVAVGPDGQAVVTGITRSPDFATTADAYRPAYASGYRGGGDAFVARIDNSPSPSPPCLSVNGLVNGASFRPGPVSPGEIVSFFGAGLGPETPMLFSINGGDRLDTELAGTQVFFDGVPAPIVATSERQVNAIVPYSVATRDTVTVRVDYNGRVTADLRVPVGASSPAIFTADSSGRGPGAILNEDSSVNSPANPTGKRRIVQIFATGEGQTNPPGIDGKVALDALPAPLLPVTVTIGGVDAPVKYAGAAPDMVAGLIQINAEVLPSMPSGNAVPVVIKIGDNTSPPGVTLAIQ